MAVFKSQFPMFAKKDVISGSRKQQGRHWEIQTWAASAGQWGSLLRQVSFPPTLYLTTILCTLKYLMMLDPDQPSDQVHQAEPGPGVVQQHQVLLLWPAKWAWRSLQQNSRQRLEGVFGVKMICSRSKGFVIFYQYDQCSSLGAKNKKGWMEMM